MRILVYTYFQVYIIAPRYEFVYYSSSLFFLFLEYSNKRLVTIWAKIGIFIYFETAGLIFITIAPTIANNKIRDVIISHKK